MTLLAVYLVLLFAVPSRLTIGPLGGAGSPALVLGAGCGFLWMFALVQRDAVAQVGPQPVKRAMTFLVLSFMVSYIVAMIRPIPLEERAAADLGLVTLLAWAGVVFFVHDGVPSVSRFLDLTRYVTFGGAAVAALGILQFATGQQLVDRLSIPGLSENSAFVAITVREGFNRPNGTALHPIEFGAVLTMILPLALALALSDTDRGKVRRWTPPILILAAITLSVSRSAILGAAVGVVILAATLPGHTVRRLAAAGTVFAALVFLTVPGMLGTMLGLFTNAGDDPSVASRTDSYAIAADYFRHSPVFGRGFGTFLPSYRIFDNQYLLSSLEVGVVGVVAMLWLIGAAAYAGRRIRTGAIDPTLSLVGQALTASVLVAGTGLAIYDGFSFPMGTGTMFLVIGMAGCGYRLQRVEAAALTGPAAESRRHDHEPAPG